jgi:predicted nuclease with TOPRIM domain
MMQEEFEKRIGLVITGEEYEEIEAAYRGMPNSVDKDKFVKIWLREGGIQDLFDKRLFEIRKRRESMKEILKEKDEVWKHANNYEAEIQDLKMQIKALNEKLAVINEIVKVVT